MRRRSGIRFAVELHVDLSGRGGCWREVPHQVVEEGDVYCVMYCRTFNIYPLPCCYSHKMAAEQQRVCSIIYVYLGQGRRLIDCDRE